MKNILSHIKKKKKKKSICLGRQGSVFLPSPCKFIKLTRVLKKNASHYLLERREEEKIVQLEATSAAGGAKPYRLVPQW